MGKSPFIAFVPKFWAWSASQAPAVVSSAALDVEAHILEWAISVDQVHALACSTGFTGTSDDLINALGGYFVYAGLLPGIRNGALNFSPPSGSVAASGSVGGGGGRGRLPSP